MPRHHQRWSLHFTHTVKIYDPCVFRAIDSSDFKGIECNVTSTLGQRLPHCSNVDRTLHTVEPPQKRVYLGESRVRTGLNHCFLVIRFDAVKISDICDRWPQLIDARNLLITSLATTERVNKSNYSLSMCGTRDTLYSFVNRFSSRNCGSIHVWLSESKWQSVRARDYMVEQWVSIPANTRRWPNAGSVLGQPRRRWLN